MQITQAAILPRRFPKGDPAETILESYITRAARYLPCRTLLFPNETALLQSLRRTPGQPAALLVLCDSQGQQLSSEEFATHLRQWRDRATQRLVLAIGPPDGWSSEARAQAHLLFSFGPITLPHQLARVVLAEQVYRALTILAGHPYHCGH